MDVAQTESIPWGILRAYFGAPRAEVLALIRVPREEAIYRARVTSSEVQSSRNGTATKARTSFSALTWVF
jgi:hypothetical protein